MIWATRKTKPKVHWTVWSFAESRIGCISTTLTTLIARHPRCISCIQSPEICFGFGSCHPIWTPTS